MNVNLVAFSGRLGQSPEFKQVSEKFKTCVFSLCVNKRVKDDTGKYGDKPLWLRCKAYNHTAETINKYVSKGDMLFVQGSIDIDQWTDKEGKQQSITFVQVDSVQLFPKKEGAGLPQSEPTREEIEDRDPLPF